MLVVPGTTLFLVAAVIEPLRAANRIAGRPLYRWRLFSPSGDSVENGSRVPVAVDGAFDPGQCANPLYVLASYDWEANAGPTLPASLSRAARYRPVIAGIESGVWLLAAAGLLNEHTAPVHWEDRETFALRFPRVTVSAERYVIDDKRHMAGGLFPTLELMLELIRRQHGHTLALEVSRLFLYQDSAPTSGDTVLAAGIDRRVTLAVHMMQESIDTPLKMETLARAAGIGARHLRALFVRGLGVTPQQHYLALRLNAARRHVIETRASMVDIATAAGFGSLPAFSRAYRTYYGESPSGTRGRLAKTLGSRDACIVGV
ncbi:helix-turn-helix domain-containing protein [Ameyamaea chiangmaiensis]|uniref:GlxA family transcriptional regulator n=1 Tax=Ameyamaea chiangmaiensis TaxID=442969 RepID=UPI001BAFDB55|nr:helix-turn-helix domain-containing protein [Ameyamaea chiangmaiensis]MBS4076062.1 helix-turn-helix domain-containing protein [Ameyamaea chiangmaiensis]